eukprot:477045_1
MHRFRACKEMNISAESCFTYNNDGEYFYGTNGQYLLSNLTNAHWNNIRTLTLKDGFSYKYEGGDDCPYWIDLFEDLATCNTSNIKSIYVSGAYSRMDPCVEIL